MPKYDNIDELYTRVAGNKPGLTKEQFAVDMRDPQKAGLLFDNITSAGGTYIPNDFPTFVKQYGFDKPLPDSVKKAAQQAPKTDAQGTPLVSLSNGGTAQPAPQQAVDKGIELPKNFDFSAKSSNPEAQAMIDDRNNLAKIQAHQAQEEQKKMEDSFKMSTGLYQQTKNGVAPIEQDSDKFLKQYDKAADTYFITQHNQGWTEEEKKTMPLVQEYYRSTTDEQKADIRKQIQEIVPAWNPLPKEQWDVLDSMKLGVYESSAATEHHVQKEYNDSPVAYGLQEMNGMISGEPTLGAANDQANSMADTYARAYYLGENIHDISNWESFGQSVTKALTNPVSNWAGRYQTNEEYVSNLQSVYKSYFDRKNQADPKADDKTEGDTKKFMDTVQAKTLNPTFLRELSTTAGGLIGSLPYYVAASAAGNELATISGLSQKLIDGSEVINSLGGEFMKKTLTDAVPMAMMDTDKRRGMLMGYAFGAAGTFANKIGIAIEDKAYNGAMKLLMNGMVKPAIKGGVTAGTSVAFDAAQAMASSDDFEKDLKNKGLDWMSKESKSFFAQLVCFGIMGKFDGGNTEQLDKTVKEFEAQKRKTKDKGEREKLDKIETQVKDMAAKESSPLNDKIVEQAVNANPDHMAPPAVISHTIPGGTKINTTSHVDFENGKATIPSASFDNAESATSYSDRYLSDNGISEVSFTSKEQADAYTKQLPEKGYNSYVVTTGTEDKPQVHVIAYNKSNSTNAGLLNDMRIREAQGATLSLNDVATMAGLRGQDPVEELQKIVQQSNENSRGIQAKNAQAVIDRINTARKNQSLPNELVDKIQEAETEKKKKLPSQEAVGTINNDIKATAAEHGWVAEVQKDGTVEVKDEKGEVKVTTKTKPAFSKEGLTQLQEIIDNHAKMTDATKKADFYKQAQEVAKKEGMTIGYDHNNRIVARRGSKVVVSAQVGYKSLEDFQKKSPELSSLIEENNIFYRLTNLPSDKKNFSVVIPGMDDTEIKNAVSDIFAGHSNYMTEKLLNRLAKYADGTELVQIKSTTGRKSTMMMPEFLQKTEGDLGKAMNADKPQVALNFTDDNSATVEEQNAPEYLKTKGVENVQKEMYESLPKEKKSEIDKFVDDVMLGKKQPTEEQQKLASENANVIEQRVMDRAKAALSKPYPGIPEPPTEPTPTEQKVGMEEPATVIDTKAEGKKIIERKKSTKEIVAALHPDIQKRTVIVPKTAVDVLTGAARMGKFKEYLSSTPEYNKYAALNVDDAVMAMFKDKLITFDDANRIGDADSAFNLSQLEQLRKPITRMKTLAEQKMDEELPNKAPKTVVKKKIITAASAKSLMDNINKGDGEAIKDWVGRNGKVYDLDADALKHSEVVSIIDALKQNGVISQDQWQEMATNWKRQEIKQNKVTPPESNDVGSMIDRIKAQRAKQAGDIYKDVTQAGFGDIFGIGNHMNDVGRALRQLYASKASTPEQKEMAKRYLKNNRYKILKTCLQAINTDEKSGSTSALQRLLGDFKPGYEPSDAVLIKANNAYRDAIVNAYDAAKGEDENSFKNALSLHAADLYSHANELNEGTEKEHLKDIVSKIGAAVSSIHNKQDMDNFSKLAMGMVRYKVGNEMVLPNNLHEMRLLEDMSKQGFKPLSAEELDNFKTMLPQSEMLYNQEILKKDIADKANDVYKMIFASPQWFRNYAKNERDGQVVSDMQYVVDKNLVQIPKEQQFNYGAKMVEMSKGLTDRTAKILAYGKYVGEKIYSDEELKNGIETDEGKIVLNDNEIASYNQYHDLTADLGEHILATERMKDTSYEGLTDAQKLQWNQQKREELLGLGGYAKFDRQGDFAVFAHGTNWLTKGKVGESGPVKNYWRFETQKEASDFSAKISKQGYHGYGAKDDEGEPTPVSGSLPNVYQISQQSKDITAHLSNMQAADMVYDAIMKGRDYDDLSKQEKDALAIIEQKQSDFLDKAKRKKIFKAIPGVDTTKDNVMQSMASHINRVTMNLGRATSKYTFDKLIPNVQEPELKKMMEDWHENLNNKARSPIAGYVSQVAYLKFLAGSMAHVSRVFYGSFTTIPTYLSSLGHDMDAKFHKDFINAIPQAMKYTQENQMGIPSIVSKTAKKLGAPSIVGISPELHDAMEIASHRGVLGTSQIDFALNNVPKTGSIIEKVANASVLNIEAYSRAHAFIVGYGAAKSKGLKGEEAQDYATNVVYKTCNNYNRTNQALVYGKNPDAANFLKIYTLFKQQHMNFNQLLAPIVGDTFNSWQDAKKTFRSQAPSLLMGGMNPIFNIYSLTSRALPIVSASIHKYGFKGTATLATPFLLAGAAMYSANKAYNSQTGEKNKSLSEHIDDAAKEIPGGHEVVEYTKDGLLGLMGIDPSNMTDLGATIGKGGFTNAASTMEGNMSRAWNDAIEGDWKHAVQEAAPSAIGNWMKADDYQQNGLKLHQGMNWKPDNAEANEMRFGFKPLSEHRAYDIKDIMKDFEDKKVTLSHHVENTGHYDKSYVAELNQEYYKAMAHARMLGGTDLKTDAKFEKHLREGLITQRMVKGWEKKEKK